MDKFKPIISHQEGQNLFPGLPTVIKGDKSSTNITMKNTKDQIALTPYGASYMTPGQDYAFAGNTVAELPMAQMGGEDPEQDQIMQILQVYAQMKQIPIEELMQQLQSLPEEQQQQALSSIVQDVQKTMQEQQMGQQQQPEMGQQDQQGMMEQEQEMPMAMHGGEPCTDCEEQFPQAQNLNWFYKAQVGKQVYTPENRAQDSTYYADYAIPANMRKIALGNIFDSYEQIGRAEDYGYDPSAEEMVEHLRDPKKIGYSNARQASIDAFRNKGAAGKLYLTNNEVAEIAKRFKDIDAEGKYTTPNNPMYGSNSYDLKSTLSAPDYRRVQQEINRNKNKKAEGGEAFPQANPYPHMYAQGGEAFPQAQTYLPYDRGGNPVPNFMFQQGGDLDQYGGSTDIDQAYQMMKRGGFDMNPKKKKGGKFDAGSFQDYVMKNGGYLPKHQFKEATIGQNLSQPSGSYNMWGSPTIPTAVSQSPAFQQVQDYNANATRIADQNVVKQGTDQMGYKPSNSTYPKQNPKTSMYNLFSQAFPTKPKRQNVVGAGLKALASAVDFGGSMYNGKGLFPAQQGGLPKHQFNNSTTGVNQSQTPASTFFMPDSMQYNTAFNNWAKQNSMMNPLGFDPSNTTTNTQGFGYSFNPGSTADPNNPNFEQPLYNQQQQQQKQQQKRGFGFNTPFAARQVSNLNNIGGFLQGINELKAEDKELAKGINSSAWMPVQQSNDRGDYMNNNGMFRPNDYQYSQSAPGMQNQQAFYAQAGGPLDMFEDGEEYDLDENTINLILAMGGSVEYL